MVDRERADPGSVEYCLISLAGSLDTLVWNGTGWTFFLPRALRFPNREVAVREMQRFQSNKRIQLRPAEDVDRWRVEQTLMFE